MAVGNHPGSARLLRELQGVRLVNATSQTENSEEDRTVERHGASNEPHSRWGLLTSITAYHPSGVELQFLRQEKCSARILTTTGTGLFPSKEELPVWKALWDSRPSCLRILHSEGCGDRSILETIVNVATSMPFIAIGLQVPRTKPVTRLYAGSLVGVGVASTLYHTSRGKTRKAFRFGDYAMIAVASLCLNAAIKDDHPKALILGSALLIPIQPILVSVIHTGMMEATFSQRVKTEPKLKRAHSLHKLSSLLGGALFVADDLMPQTPYIHAAWHLAAALGVATANKLLE